MAAESIISYKKLKHPEYRVSDSSVRTDIDYVGPYDTLFATLTSELLRGQGWGDYPGLVSDISIRSIEGTNPAQGELTVSVEYALTVDGSDFGFESGTKTGVVYEIDWTVIGRPLIEHPVFRSGGRLALSSVDLTNIAEWEKDRGGIWVGEENVDKYIEGVLQGIESWDDFAPVLTKTTSYTGGPPPTSEAGQKDNPAGFPNIPTGYEWIKSADRSLRTGARDKWDRTEQWLGSKKVLVDRDEVFY